MGLIQPVKLEAPLLRRGSLLKAEADLLASDGQSKSIVYRPISKWTDQPTTDELLDKKWNLRVALTENIDFPGFQRPLLSNAHAKLERLDAARPLL